MGPSRLRFKTREKARHDLTLRLPTVPRLNLLGLIHLLAFPVAKALVRLIPLHRRLDALLRDVVHAHRPPLRLARPGEAVVGEVDRVLDRVVGVPAGRERHLEILRHAGILDGELARLRRALVVRLPRADLLVAIGAARAGRAGHADLGVELLVGLLGRVDVAVHDHHALLQLARVVGVLALVHGVSVVAADLVGHVGFAFVTLTVGHVVLLAVILGLADAEAVGGRFRDFAVGHGFPEECVSILGWGCGCMWSRYGKLTYQHHQTQA